MLVWKWFGRGCRIISEHLTIPTIGIGAGRYCDGQVQVINDLLGMTPRKLHHVKEYADYKNTNYSAVNNTKMKWKVRSSREKVMFGIWTPGNCSNLKPL